jgi:hypothetical protein
LDLIEYYLDSKGTEVCRIDGSVKLEERRRQVNASHYQYISVLLERIVWESVNMHCKWLSRIWHVTWYRVLMSFELYGSKGTCVKLYLFNIQLKTLDNFHLC